MEVLETPRTALQILSIPKGDKGWNLAFTLTDDSGTVRNLTGYTGTIKMWAPGVAGTLLVNGAIVLDTPASGTCHYVVATDAISKGHYLAELELSVTGIVDSTTLYEIRLTESG